MLKRKLLLADDSITIQKVVNLTFADEGIEVISVGDGDSAMIKIDEYAPDLILADVNMPGLNGYQICERIKQNPETKKIPVILLVGSFEPFDEAEAYRVGADDYLTKPFQSIRQLVTKVSELLEAAGTDTATTATDAEVETESDAANVHFFNTVEMLPAEVPIETKQFDDSSFDDEMIQTSQIGSLPTDEIQKFIADSMPESSNAATASGSFNSEFDFYRTVEAEEDFGKTTPLDINDLRAFSGETGENVEQTNGAVIYEIVPEESASEYIPEIDTAAQAEINQPDIQTEIESDESYSLRQESSVSENEAVLSPEFARVTAEPARSSFSGAPDFLFDDLNLLDLPPIEMFDEKQEDKSPFDLPPDHQSEDAGELKAEIEDTQTSSEFEKRQVEFENIQPEIIEQSPENEAAAESAEHDQAETSAQAEIDRQIAALPPEIIEAIARKVAEKMSDRAIREIAWEVVPQMTDLIVRRMAEEKLKE